MSRLSRRGFVTTATNALLAPVWSNRALGQTVDPRVPKVLAAGGNFGRVFGAVTGA